MTERIQKLFPALQQTLFFGSLLYTSFISGCGLLNNLNNQNQKPAVTFEQLCNQLKGKEEEGDSLVKMIDEKSKLYSLYSKTYTEIVDLSLKYKISSNKEKDYNTLQQKVSFLRITYKKLIDPINSAKIRSYTSQKSDSDNFNILDKAGKNISPIINSIGASRQLVVIGIIHNNTILKATKKDVFYPLEFNTVYQNYKSKDLFITGKERPGKYVIDFQTQSKIKDYEKLKNSILAIRNKSKQQYLDNDCNAK